jgi:hypothetical protein
MGVGRGVLAGIEVAVAWTGAVGASGDGTDAAGALLPLEHAAKARSDSTATIEIVTQQK